MANGPRASAHLPRPGDTIAGKYVLERLLGQAGMGAVFAARHLKLAKAVAIKVMLADRSNPEALTRFINEGRAAANIQNEHVVRVDDVDEEQGYAYMVLELLEGEDLGELLDRELSKRLPPPQAVGYVLQALRGVAQAHAIGIVHRDLKPTNLFLAKRADGPPVVKVLDFGISKATGSNPLTASPSALTSTAAMLGSPLYMSPEQLRRSKSVDHHSDIWAMGIILYELMSGTLPFGGDTIAELFVAILEATPTPLGERVDGIPPGLDAVVMRCLEKLPENRFQSAGELAQALMPFAPATAIVPDVALAYPPPAPIVGGTAPLGAMSPMSSSALQAMQQSGSGWHHSSTTAGSARKSRMPLLAGLFFGALLLIGTTFIALSVLSSRRRHAPSPSTAAAPAVASTSSEPEMRVTEIAPTPSSATMTEADPPPAASATTKHAPAVAKPPGVKPEHPKPKPPPTPARSETNNSGNLQNAR
jgi:serine/threonine-protein kinase